MKEFIAAHMAVLAGMDFFTAEVLTWRGPATVICLFVISWRHTARNAGRHYPAPDSGVDATGCSQSDRCRSRPSFGASGICFLTATRNSVIGFDLSFATEEWNQCGFRQVLRI